MASGNRNQIDIEREFTYFYEVSGAINLKALKRRLLSFSMDNILK